jgi:ubiquitin-conjugating enzyme E2 variant
VTCGPNYPNEPPVIRFVTRINLNCVDQRTGMVTPDLPALSGWNRNMGIETVLVAIKNSMTTPANRRLSQPSEGSTF